MPQRHLPTKFGHRERPHQPQRGKKKPSHSGVPASCPPTPTPFPGARLRPLRRRLLPGGAHRLPPGRLRQLGPLRPPVRRWVAPNPRSPHKFGVWGAPNWAGGGRFTPGLGILGRLRASRVLRGWGLGDEGARGGSWCCLCVCMGLGRLFGVPPQPCFALQPPG